MGEMNFLIEGVSCAGKTTVCDEFIRRGYQAIHGDRELAYRGDPDTGRPSVAGEPSEHIWSIDQVRSLVADRNQTMTFFCGGSRNAHRFLDLFDLIFILEIDRQTLERRLAARPANEWGADASECEAFARFQYETGHGLPPDAISIDATTSVTQVADAIIGHVRGLTQRDSR